MPPYKLQIDVPEFKTDPRFKQFLKFGDIVREEMFSIKPKITNIGSETFPGGTIVGLRIEQVQPLGGGLSMDWKGRELENLGPIPALPPNGSWESGEFSTLVLWEGLTQIQITATAMDNQPIQYHRASTTPPMSSWTFFITSINRERLLILEQLIKVREATERAGRK